MDINISSLLVVALVFYIVYNNNNNNNKPLPPTPYVQPKYDVNDRDRRVLNDLYYPVYGRTEKQNIDVIANNPLFHQRTREAPDTYRPLALAQDQTNNGMYYLMGRQKYKGSSQGEFYLIPTDTQNRLKIQLLDSSNNQLIKDIYNLPQELQLKTGLFAGRTFKLEELQKSDFTSDYV